MFNELICEPVNTDIKNHIIADVEANKAVGIYPKLAVIRAGENSSQIYYENAISELAKQLGIDVQVISFPESVNQGYLEMALQTVNMDSAVHGIILLRPFPEHIDEERLRGILSPEKDVDGITDHSIANVYVGRTDAFYPCTAEACMEVAGFYNIDLEGKKVSIIGRSLTVGKPLATMMLQANATITVCHSRTPEEDQIRACRDADIVILARGAVGAYGTEYFRDGQIVLDVGTTPDEEGKLHGDLNIEEIRSTGKIQDLTYTPVPGGIGKVTTAILLRNILKAVNKRHDIRTRR